MGFNMLLTAALLLLFCSAACRTQGQGIEEGSIVRGTKAVAGWKEQPVLARQDEWMQEGGAVSGAGQGTHEAGDHADLGVMASGAASEFGQGVKRTAGVQRAGVQEGKSLGGTEEEDGSEIGLVEESSFDERSQRGDAWSSRPDVHLSVEGSSQGVHGGEFEGPEGNGGALSSMQLERGKRFSNHTSKATARSREKVLATVAGESTDGKRVASGLKMQQIPVLLNDDRGLRPRRRVLSADESTDWGPSGDPAPEAASTLWHLLPLKQGRSQWMRVPAFSRLNPSKPALRLARRIHERLQRARALAEENAASLSVENTFDGRYLRLEGFAPGPAPLQALGAFSMAPNPGFAPNPAPGFAPNPGPAPGPALAPAPAYLPSAPTCPNITIPGLNPSPDRKTAYSNALALAAIKLVASNLTATKNWRGDDPCDNDWPRVLCEQQADGLFYVVQLDLSYMFLGGTIIPGICQLSKLRYLSLAGNNISGSLPPSLGAMPRLQVLHLYDNNLTGPLPPELGWLSQLEELRAEMNGLNGTVPASLGALQNIVLLSLSQNRLSGQIPPSLGSCQNLMIMRVNNNGLIGSLPASLTDLINLQELDLSFNNLTGPVWPYLLGKLSRVQILKLNNNNLAGSLDSTVGDMRALQTLELSNNKLQGTLPSRLSELHNLQYVSLKNNQLSGIIPKELGYNSNINYLMLSNNTLNGYLPDALGNILNLLELWLDGNQFSGPLPSGLGNLVQLKKMHLENNYFTGGLPDNFNGLSYLQELWLDNNALSDPLNPLLAQCSSLSALSMNNNNATGGLPSEYGSISGLTYMSLANNSLTGPIPLTFGNLTGLRVMALQNNQLNGTIPPTLGKLTYLQQLWLQNNSLEGAIPPQLGNLKNVDLRLDGNLNMCGPFFPKACPSPPGVAPSPSPQCPTCPPASGVQSWTGSCECVDALTLQFRFGTKLPFDSARKELLSLSLANGLGILRQQVNLVGNVMYNGTNAYMTVTVLPLGNVSLTEAQIRAMVRGLKLRSVALPESMQDVALYEVVGVEVPPGISLTDPSPSPAVIAGAVTGSVAALLLVLCTVSYFLYKRLKRAREKRASLEEGGSFDGSIASDDQETQRRRFSTFLLKCLAKAPGKNRGGVLQTGGSEWAREMDYWELRRATSNFGRSRLIGEGGFGRVYRARMDDGSVLAVKRLNEKSSQGESEFWAEVSTLGRLAHPHLVKLVGYCSHRGERLVAYEYMPKGSLKDYLHGYGSQKAVLDWPTRMRIAVGAAEGLAFLHAAIPSVIHRDFKSSNILLDGDLGARVADFGLAREGPSEPVTHVSTQVRGTLGYSAPEYVMSGRLTTKSDVYSFGVVLLELITGRTCVDPLQPPGMEYLVDWAKPKLGVTEKLLKITDPDIASRVPLEQLLRLASVAASCLRSKPHDRPSMVAVLDHLLPLIMSPRPSPRADLLEPGLPYSPPQTGALLTALDSSHQYEPGGETGTLSRTQSWGSAESFETAEVGSPWHARYSFGPRLVMSDSSMQEKARQHQQAPDGGRGTEHRSY